MINKESWSKLHKESSRIGHKNIIEYRLSNETLDDMFDSVEDRSCPGGSTPYLCPEFRRAMLLGRPVILNDDISYGQIVVVRREGEKIIHETIIIWSGLDFTNVDTENKKFKAAWKIESLDEGKF